MNTVHDVMNNPDARALVETAKHALEALAGMLNQGAFENVVRMYVTNGAATELEIQCGLTNSSDECGPGFIKESSCPAA